jgi:hypothetical protein
MYDYIYDLNTLITSIISSRHIGHSGFFNCDFFEDARVDDAAAFCAFNWVALFNNRNLKLEYSAADFSKFGLVNLQIFTKSLFLPT